MYERAALTVAGSDSGGGAGIQADLKTFEAHGVYGASVVTALTAQNTVGVWATMPVSPDFVRMQLRAVLEDFDFGAAKTGMLADAGIVGAVAEELAQARIPLVVDPVMISTSGHALLAPSAVDVLRERLLPLAAVVTPNLPELFALAGMDDPVVAGERLSRRYPGVYFLVKGGHADGDRAEDVLWRDGRARTFSGPRVQTTHDHGTGCTLSAAIAARLASGEEVVAAVEKAKRFVYAALVHAPRHLGKGRGPIAWRH
jgi:hydroxymethylpyrimidine/phosphomethylpyrimidine kinase